MKILILSCSTGGGHNAAARAVCEQFEKKGHTVHMMDPFSLKSDRLADRIGKTYIQTASHFPRFFGSVYKLGGKISSSRHKSPIYLANSLMVRRFRQFLSENSFDAIVMPHLFPAEIMTALKRRHVPLPPTFVISTDYTCIPFFEETECDYYFVPHELLMQEDADRGIPSDKLYPLGIPVSTVFTKKISQEKARVRLHLPVDKPVYLVMSGSMGFGKMHLFVYELSRRLTGGEQLIIICGNNAKTRRILNYTYRRNKNIHITGFTDHVSEYMDASDVIFTKPGGLTSTEALVKNIPIVFTAPIPGCETRNREFFVSNGLALASDHVYTQISQGMTLVSNMDLRNAMIKTQRHFAKPSAAADIVDFIEKKVNTL